LHGNSVALVDSTRPEPNAVICATGYQRGLEPLVGHLGVLDDHGVPRAGAPRSAARGLCLIGLLSRPSLIGHVAQQSRPLAKQIATPIPMTAANENPVPAVVGRLPARVTAFQQKPRTRPTITRGRARTSRARGRCQIQNQPTSSGINAMTANKRVLSEFLAAAVGAGVIAVAPVAAADTTNFRHRHRPGQATQPLTPHHAECRDTHGRHHTKR
jgi:hypothetical protein